MVARAVISDKNQIDTVLIDNKDFPKTKIVDRSKGNVQINQVLPFRIRFTDIKIPGYGPNNVPPIGIQVIGYSNYIL
jgi:hypothetical protein